MVQGFTVQSAGEGEEGMGWAGPLPWSRVHHRPPSQGPVDSTSAYRPPRQRIWVLLASPGALRLPQDAGSRKVCSGVSGPPVCQGVVRNRDCHGPSRKLPHSQTPKVSIYSVAWTLRVTLPGEWPGPSWLLPTGQRALPAPGWQQWDHEAVYPGWGRQTWPLGSCPPRLAL